MRVSVLDVQHKKPLTGRPRFFGKLSHASRGVRCPHAKFSSDRRGKIRHRKPRYDGPCGLELAETGLMNRFIQLMQLDVPSALSRRRPGSTFAVGTGFRRCSGI